MAKRLINPYFWIMVWVTLVTQSCHIGRLHKTQYQKTTHFQYLTLNSTLKYKDKANTHQFNIQFRIDRQHLIWFTARTSWGIEIARGRITPYTIAIIDHLNHQYYTVDYATLQAKWQCPCSYALIEALLLGELPKGYQQHIKQKPADQSYIRQQSDHWQLTAQFDPKTAQMGHLTVIDLLTQEQLNVYYQAWKVYAQILLFTHAQLSLGTIRAAITHKNIYASTQPLTFPFRIPQSYDKI